MDKEKMRFISAVIMLITALLNLLRYIRGLISHNTYSYFSSSIVLILPTFIKKLFLGGY
ncbi:hypothetical protein [Methanobrevibacter sp.]|uniref:hypothetical protein n=1 Tax=Methanobrevibacter sp. TaxID=66852 RepID=UPI0026E06D28|nr:hypothetical protein [Methanobrevibacter sp.]MDO5859333.1 hypothetical protein [Methanobrevibacter sp.]